MNYELLVRPNILALAPYSTARDEQSDDEISIWLDANESPYDNGVNRYPDPHQRILKARLAELKGQGVERIFVGNGSDEAIDLCFRIFCEPGQDNAVAIAPSYGMYEVAAATNNVELRQVMLREGDFALPEQELLEACDDHTHLLWVCSPNNPTGNAFPLSQLERLCDRFQGMVVVDEAYADFSQRGSMLSVLENHPNLIVLQTLSKAWGMAGLRLGLAFAAPEVASLMARVKYPYNVNGPTQREVLCRLENTPLGEHVAQTVSERERLRSAMAACSCVEHVYPSDANFLLVRTADADGLYRFLSAHGVMVRNRHRVPGCRGCLRLTIGTPMENDRLLHLLSKYPSL